MQLFFKTIKPFQTNDIRVLVFLRFVYLPPVPGEAVDGIRRLVDNLNVRPCCDTGVGTEILQERMRVCVLHMYYGRVSTGHVASQRATILYGREGRMSGCMFPEASGINMALPSQLSVSAGVVIACFGRKPLLLSALTVGCFLLDFLEITRM